MHYIEMLTGYRDLQNDKAEILPRLFTKFATKSDMAGGTGLGLFISKSIVAASVHAYNDPLDAMFQTKLL
jgi:hypothetical protein